MPDPVRNKMEQSFQTDFSDVRIREGGVSSESGIQAMTRGNEIVFAPGQYRPHATAGQQLLGHELAHVVQQRDGRVHPTEQLKDVAVNDSPALEREADILGQRASRGETVSTAVPSSPSKGRPHAAGGVLPVQFSKRGHDRFDKKLTHIIEQVQKLGQYKQSVEFPKAMALLRKKRKILLSGLYMNLAQTTGEGSLVTGYQDQLDGGDPTVQIKKELETAFVEELPLRISYVFETGMDLTEKEIISLIVRCEDTPVIERNSVPHA